MMIKLFKSFAILGLLTLAPASELRAQAPWPVLDPKQVVTIYGQISAHGTGIWRSNTNGAFIEGATTGEGFRVPPGKTLVILQADVTYDGELAKPVSIEFRMLPLGTSSFPVGRLSFRNTSGMTLYTATKTFNPGLLFPGGSQVSVIEKAPKPGKFEVILYGFYLK